MDANGNYYKARQLAWRYRSIESHSAGNRKHYVSLYFERRHISSIWCEPPPSISGPAQGSIAIYTIYLLWQTFRIKISQGWSTPRAVVQHGLNGGLGGIAGNSHPGSRLNEKGLA
jgi:hypothetical protein